jgi:hypothetical protein
VAESAVFSSQLSKSVVCGEGEAVYSSLGMALEWRNMFDHDRCIGVVPGFSWMVRRQSNTIQTAKTPSFKPLLRKLAMGPRPYRRATHRFWRRPHVEYWYWHVLCAMRDTVRECHIAIFLFIEAVIKAKINP